MRTTSRPWYNKKVKLVRILWPHQQSAQAEVEKNFQDRKLAADVRNKALTDIHEVLKE
jgi:hypothetical protein